MYKLTVKLLNTEMAFRLFMFNIKLLDRLRLLGFFKHLGKVGYGRLRCNVFGIDFDGPLGLGAGLDKEGLYYNEFADYGLSFVITGPTNGEMIRKSIAKIRQETPHTIVMTCISEDHATCFALAYDFMDAFVIDAPDEQLKDAISNVLDIRLSYEVQKPVLMKISKEYSSQSLKEILDFALMNGVDGFVAGSNVNVKKINEFCQGRIPIIGYGGIRSPNAAEEMLDSGASLVALTTGVVLDGPGLIKRILKHLDSIAATMQ